MQKPGKQGERSPGKGGLPWSDRGQTAIEYLGIIAVVVAIVLVLTRTDFGNAIASAISDKISQVTSG